MHDHHPIRLTLIVLALLLPLHNQTHAVVLSERSVVVDDAAAKVLTNDNARAAFFEFCRKPPGDNQRPIKRIYLKPGWHGFGQVSADDDKLKSFISNAHNLSIEVYCIQGHHGWILPGRREQGVQIVDAVIDYNKQADPRQRFDGILLDIRVHVMNTEKGHGIDWSLNARPIWRSYTRLIDRIAGRVRRHNRKMDHPVQLAITMPAQFPGRSSSTGHYRDMMDRVDMVWLICDTDDNNTLAEQIQDEVTLAEKGGKTIVLGLTVDPPVEGTDRTEYHTFYDNGLASLEQTINKIASRFPDHDSLPEACTSSYTHLTRMDP